MQPREGASVFVALLLVLSALGWPAAAAAPPGPSTGGGGGVSSDAVNHTPADPPTDVLGWEAGYWHNESLDVDTSDGLNETERNATKRRAMARVEVIRQLEFQEDVPFDIVSREEFREREANRTTSPELRTFDNAKFEALFLVPESVDSIQVQQENRGGVVLGQYNSRTDQMVVVSGQNESLQLNELTLAHELMHALQDQHFNLSASHRRTRDGVNARNGLVEGDARLVELQYERRCGDGSWAGTCLSPSEDGASGGGELANVGIYLLKFQPYSEGPTFVTSLYDDGGWTAVNAAYDDLPASTEQVIHPERYRVDAPTDVALEDRHSDPWERVRPPNRPDYGTVGEAAVFTMLWFPGFDSRVQTEIVPYALLFNETGGGQLSSYHPFLFDHAYSAGWDGDRLHVYVDDDNETAYVWRLVWDDPEDAREFAGAYRELLGYWGGEEVRPGLWVIDDGGFADAFHLGVDGDTVTVVNAPTVEDLPAVRGSLEVTPSPTASPTSVDPVTPTGSTSPSATSPGQPGFGALVALAALGALLLWRRGR